MRAQAAALLRENPDESHSEIAKIVGFSSHHPVSRLATHITDIRPKKGNVGRPDVLPKSIVDEIVGAEGRASSKFTTLVSPAISVTSSRLFWLRTA